MRYTEGQGLNGVVVLDNGKPMKVSEIIEKLNKANEYNSNKIKLEEFIERINPQKNLDPEFNDIVNEEFWRLI